jgi:hypothetical protein
MNESTGKLILRLTLGRVGGDEQFLSPICRLQLAENMFATGWSRCNRIAKLRKIRLFLQSLGSHVLVSV